MHYKSKWQSIKTKSFQLVVVLLTHGISLWSGQLVDVGKKDSRMARETPQ